MRNFRGNDREDDHGKEAQNQECRGEEENRSQDKARRAGAQEEAHRAPCGQKGEAGAQGQGASQGRQNNCQAGRQVNRKAKASSGEDRASATYSRDERPSTNDGARPRGDADRTAAVAVSIVGAG
jgi:hypothetical protein